ncbi:hypothetical protein WJX82_000358 [Trebouxia sp. C0006]
MQYYGSYSPALTVLGRPAARQQLGRDRLRVRSQQDSKTPRNRDQDRSPPSRRDLMKSGATLGFGGAAVRALRLLGVSELGQVPRGLTPLLAEVSKGTQLLQQVGSKLQPTVQHLLNIGMKPADVARMLENPALRPHNAAELQRWLR